MVLLTNERSITLTVMVALERIECLKLRHRWFLRAYGRSKWRCLLSCVGGCGPFGVYNGFVRRCWWARGLI